MIHGAEVLCYTERVVDAPSFNIYTGRNDANNPIKWSHNVPAGILDSVVRVGLYIEAWDVDYPPDGDEYDRVYFNGYDLGHLVGSNDSWFTVEKTVPVAALKEGINNLEVWVDEAGKSWKVTIRASELRFYCSSASPDFSIGATPASLEVFQGESAQYTVDLTGLNGFNGAVDLSISGLPAGASVSFGVNPLTPSPTASTAMTIATTTGTAVGSYTVTITGESGGTAHETQVTLKIKEPEAPEQDFTVSAQPGAQDVHAGEQVTYNVSVTAVNGYDKKVKLGIEGLPEGATAQFDPEIIAPGSQSELTIVTAAGTPLGNHNLTVKAKRDRVRTAKVKLNVLEALEGPDFTIEADPLSQTVPSGQSAEYTLGITPLNNFGESVTFSVSGLPAGVTADIDPQSLTPGNTAKLTVTTTGQTPLDVHSFTVTGEAGELSHGLELGLEVTCPGFTVSASAEPLGGPAPLAVLFSGEVVPENESPATYSVAWDFGDGSASDQQNPSHTYQQPGNYKAKLTVTDTCGNQQTAVLNVTAEGFEGALSKTFSVSEAVPGQEVDIVLTAKNETRLDFGNIIIRDQLSPYLEYIEDTAAVTPRRDRQEFAWQFPTLERGGSISFTIKVKVAEDAPAGVIANTAFLLHGSMKPGERITSNTANLTVNHVAVTLHKHVDKTEAKPGDSLKYTLTFKNDSNVPLTGMKLTDELPQQMEFTGQTHSGVNLTFNRQGRYLEWTGTLEPGQQAVVMLEAKIGHNVFSGTRLENSAGLEAQPLKTPVVSNTVVTTVTAQPVTGGKVRFSKRTEVPQADVGRVVRFRLTAANMSGSTLIAPVIEDHLPQGFAYVAGTTLVNNQRFADPQGKRRLLWTLPDIGPHQTIVIRYQTVIGADARRGRNVNRATLRTRDNSGQELFYEASAFVNVSTSSFVFYSGVEGTVYLDRDGDGFYSMKDSPLPGIEVRMSTGEKAVSDAMGRFLFEGLFPGEYAVGLNTATLPDKYTLDSSAPKIVVLSDGLTDTVEFPVKQKAIDYVNTARLEGRVYYDKNRDRQFNENEPVPEEFKVELSGVSKTRGRDGRFVFSKIKPGTYTVTVFYENKTAKKEITIKEGNNTIDIPLKFTGITIIFRGNGNNGGFGSQSGSGK